MKNYLIPLLIGTTAGIIDILPMIKQKLDKYSIRSAFAYHLIMPLIVFHLETAIPWWIKGGLVYLVCSVPILLLVANDDKKSIPIIAVTSVIIGTIVGLVFRFWVSWQ